MFRSYAIILLRLVWREVLKVLTSPRYIKTFLSHFISMRHSWDALGCNVLDLWRTSDLVDPLWQVRTCSQIKTFQNRRTWTAASWTPKSWRSLKNSVLSIASVVCVLGHEKACVIMSNQQPNKNSVETYRDIYHYHIDWQWVVRIYHITHRRFDMRDLLITFHHDFDLRKNLIYLYNVWCTICVW